MPGPNPDSRKYVM